MSGISPKIKDFIKKTRIRMNRKSIIGIGTYFPDRERLSMVVKDNSDLILVDDQSTVLV